MIANFSFPIPVSFGLGAVERLPHELGARGLHRPMLVAARDQDGSAVVNRARRLVPGCLVFSGIDPDPTEQNVLDGAETFVMEQCDTLIAVGNGRVMNAAKAIRLKVHHPHPLGDYASDLAEAAIITAEMPPLVTIPASGGGGCEVSHCTTVLVSRSRRKITIQSQHLFPSLALIDPELSIDADPFETAASGMEVLGRSLEALLSKAFHPLCEAIAAEGVRVVFQYLPVVVGNGRDLEARSAMASASLMAGTASQKGAGAARSLAQVLSAAAGIPDGEAMALVLPAVVEFNRGHDGSRIERLERLLGVADLHLALVELRTQVGLNARLRSIGIGEAELPALAEAAYAGLAHRSNPRDCSAEDLLSLYKQCW
ncbi:MAG: iron-containing alcohol dehydrogenase [Bryobacterales bacterium]|nr:iron-containing alcohol dehydrogenase [Bryobacterales bacterium]